MIPHQYVYEKLVTDRHAQIWHEMQHIRMLSQIRQRQTFIRLTIGSFGRVLISLGSYMQRVGQQHDASLILKVDTSNP